MLKLQHMLQGCLHCLYFENSTSFFNVLGALLKTCIYQISKNAYDSAPCCEQMRFHTVQQFQQSADRNTNATILPDCLRPPLATLQRRKGGSGSKMPQWVVWVPCEKQWPSATDNGLVRSLSLHWWREQSFGPEKKVFILIYF